MARNELIRFLKPTALIQKNQNRMRMLAVHQIDLQCSLNLATSNRNAHSINKSLQIFAFDVLGGRVGLIVLTTHLYINDFACLDLLLNP